MALDYAAWIHNHMPHAKTGLAPLEIFCGTRLNCTELRRVCVFGCPCYVLDPTLQDGKKLPKWAARSRQGQFLGFSNQHSATVGMIRNLQSGHISPQFHVVYNKQFNTVSSTWTPPHDDDTQWLDTFSIDHYLPNHDEAVDGKLPPLPSSWHCQPPSIVPSQEGPPARHEGERKHPHAAPPLPAISTPRVLDPPSSPNDDDTGPPTVDTLGSPIQNLSPLPTPRNRARDFMPKPGEAQDRGQESTQKQGEDSRRPQRQRRAPPQCPDPERHVTLDLPPEDSVWSHHHSQNRRYFLGTNTSPQISDTTNLNRSPQAMGMFANCIDWDLVADPHSDSIAIWYDRLFSQQATSHLGLIHDWDPRFFASKAEDTNTPSVFDLRHLNHEERLKWRSGMDCELNKLESCDTFCMVPRHTAKGKEIADCMWTLRKKRKPDGTISRYKARLVVRGDQQTMDVDKATTFAPVVDWATVRLLLTLSLQHNLTTVSIDFKNAFVQSKLPSPIYLEMLFGYGKGKENMVLEVTKSLYGDCRSPRLWYNFLSKCLHNLGFQADPQEPCMFCKQGYIWVTYVDDAIIVANDPNGVEKVLSGLKRLKMDFNHLGDLPSYLGVQIVKHDDGSVTLKQPHLTQSVLIALGLTDSQPKPTPTTKTYGKCEDTARLNSTYNHQSILGMLMYLGNNTQPDLAFAIHQCACFSANPKAPHGEALKRIGRYLQGTLNEGLILKPTKDVNLDCYVDADFAGVWGEEDDQDPACICSCTGFIITLGSCPITWSSKLQTEIALSTMEAEYITASTAMRTLVPLQHGLFNVCKWLNLAKPNQSMISTVWEDNQAAL